MKRKLTIITTILLFCTTISAQTKDEELQYANYYIQHGQFEEALTICNKYPNDAKALIVKYACYSTQGEDQKAFLCAKQSAQIGSFPFAMQIVGSAYQYGMGTPVDYVQAIKYFELLLKSEQENDYFKGLAFLNIAVSYYHLGYANTAAYWLDQYNVLYAHATPNVQAQLMQKEHFCEDIIPLIKGDKTKTTFSIEDINIIKL